MHQAIGSCFDGFACTLQRADVNDGELLAFVRSSNDRRQRVFGQRRKIKTIGLAIVIDDFDVIGTTGAALHSWRSDCAGSMSSTRRAGT